MVRTGAIFVAACGVLIAASLGALAYLYFGLSGADAAILMLGALTALALYNTVSSRLRDRNDVGTQIADLSRGSADLARQVAELARRLASTESKMESSLHKSRTIADPVAVELGELGTLVRQLAETVAAHDAAIKAGAARLQASRQAAAGVAPVVPQPVAAREGSAMRQLPADNEEMIEIVRAAIEDGRIDLYLQPIVTLPQRKVRYYEALSRLRLDNGEVLNAGDFLDFAEAGGLMPKIDNLALFRSVQVVRRLLIKNREIGLFCNIAGSTLVNGNSFSELIEFVDANRALASSLVFEFTQRTVRSLGPMEQESLAALAERGFRFSMDQVADLRFEPRELSERGFRFVKIHASLLLNRAGTSGSDIHPADLSDLLGRYGIELVADHIENESGVVDLLDFEVRYGQGSLFSPPRPVRQEALRGGPDRTQAVAREHAADQDELQDAAVELTGGRAEAGSGQRQGSLAQLARSMVDPA